MSPTRPRSSSGLATTVVGMLVAAALGLGCSDGADQRGAVTPAYGGNTAATRPAGCGPTQPPVEPAGPSSGTVVLRAAGGGEPAIEAAVYPRPDYRGDPWSQWGQGLALPDGRFLSAIGDHRGPDGNSYVFVFDPDRGRLTRFTDVLSHVEHDDGEWGYGKIHGQMLALACGDVLFSTYYGDRDGLEYGGNYTGDVLFRLDPETLEVERLGVPVAARGLPSLAGPSKQGIVYGEAVDPARSGPDVAPRGTFFAYDPQRRQVVFRSDDERHSGFRSIIVDDHGKAYLATDDNRLLVYEPGSSGLRLNQESLPEGQLRAATVPAPDGTVYGVTHDPYQLFALRPDGSIRELGGAGNYTTSLALHPDGRRFFFVPGAHGDSWEQGTPLVSVDVETGEQTTVAQLNELAEERLGLTLGGTYNVAVDPSGERVYVGFNAGEHRDEPWGEVVLVIVHLA